MRYQQNMAVQLIHISGPKKGEIDEYRDMPVTIGRHPSSSLAFPVDLGGISRHHAEIVREGNQFKLLDRSTNGTFVNGKGVQEAILRDGDVLEFSEGGPKVSFFALVVEQAKEESSYRAPAPPAREESISPSSTPAPPSGYSTDNSRLSQASYSASPAPPPPKPLEKPESSAFTKVKAPLTILCGPQIRSFKELPVVIGRGAHCDFSIDLPHILERHLQILFYDNKYWVEDLTGLHQVQVNRNPFEFKLDLHVNDEIRFGPQGPVLRFIGEGRLAEADDETSPAESGISSGEGTRGSEVADSPKSGSFWEKIKSRF